MKPKNSSDAFGAFLLTLVLAILMWVAFGVSFERVYSQYFSQNNYESRALLYQRHDNSLILHYYDQFKSDSVAMNLSIRRVEFEHVIAGEIVDIKYFENRPDLIMIKQMGGYTGLLKVLFLSTIIFGSIAMPCDLLIRSIRLRIKEIKKDKQH